MKKPVQENSRRGQAILMVFSLLLLASILIAGIATLWETRIKLGSLEKNALAALYLANGGIDRARVELAIRQDDDYEGYINETLGEGNYSVQVSNKGNRKDITSTGSFRDAMRVIKITVGRDESGVPKGKAWGWHKKIDNSWVEQ